MNTPVEAEELAGELVELLTTLKELSFHPRENVGRIYRLRALANEHVQTLAAFLATENFGTLA